MTDEARDAVIVGAEIGAGHDGSAELVVRLRYENGVVGTVVLDGKVGLALIRACGADGISELAGHSWRKILEGL
jgi:hypothetical protein